ncbi:MAG: FHA domain-containing protein [Planctomycetia bacterium]|nr:FHA domain-containing protein [Planctomycetia bacterium]
MTTKITLRILDGPDKGREYHDIPLPASIGREPQNTIPLSDERVSRYHCRIQEDHGKVLLTDVESTNGTKLNGQSIWLGVLYPGDLIAVGQTLILAGTRQEIQERLTLLSETGQVGAGRRFITDENSEQELPPSLVREVAFLGDDVSGILTRLHALMPPNLPENLTPGQAADLADLLLYVQLRLRFLVESADPQKITGRITWSVEDWQCMLDLYSRITEYCTTLTNPGE